MSCQIDTFLNYVKVRNACEEEFLQAVREVAEVVIPFVASAPKYQGQKLLERLVEPERVIMFRVPWVDDRGEIQVNRAYRVEYNSALGPYKGGLRFHPSVNLSVLKFLGFEQIFKNALTGLPMGGGKGGADFDPKGKSTHEVMRFCQSFMTELARHIGANTDVPAGDIGVGSREIGFLFGQYKRLRNEFTGVLTGKKPNWGGSLIRPEATGYGTVYFAEDMLETKNESLEKKTVAISGSGNVAQFACEKATALGAKVLTLSDSSGYIYDPDGIDAEKLSFVMALKNVKRQRISAYAEQYRSAKFFKNERPWAVKVEVALPCATQNELNEKEANTLLANGCVCVSEGANMPSTPGAVAAFRRAKILYAPGKAANAGGVATSGLEMSQNALRLSWSRPEVENKLRKIMKNIHESCKRYGTDKNGHTDYVKGANIAAFAKVANAMLDQGVV